MHRPWLIPLFWLAGSITGLILVRLVTINGFANALPSPLGPFPVIPTASMLDTVLGNGQGEYEVLIQVLRGTLADFSNPTVPFLQGLLTVLALLVGTTLGFNFVIIGSLVQSY